MSAKNCTDYWLDRETMSFVGDFEGMYRDIADPWGCDAEADGLNNQLFLELLCHRRSYQSILDIGCGLGGFTDRLWRRNGGGRAVGADVALTAVAKATARYPNIDFRVLNVLTDQIDGSYDLILLSEVLWYLLDDLPGVFRKLSRALAGDGLLGVKQYFPEVQRFGAEKLQGVHGFAEFLREKTDFRFVAQVVSHHSQDGTVLLGLLER